MEICTHTHTQKVITVTWGPVLSTSCPPILHIKVKVSFELNLSSDILWNMHLAFLATIWKWFVTAYCFGFLDLPTNLSYRLLNCGTLSPINSTICWCPLIDSRNKLWCWWLKRAGRQWTAQPPLTREPYTFKSDFQCYLELWEMKFI